MKKTKRLISLFLSIVMLLSIMAGIDLSAYAETSGDWEYEVDSYTNTVGIINYNGSAANVTVPSKINGYDVTALDGFNSCNTLKSVTIPSSIYFISGDAFAHCKNLNKVTIANGVEWIYDSAFADCISLKSFVIPNSVKEIGYYIFDGCENLTSITIPKSIKAIPRDAFYGCNKLSNVYYTGSKSEWNNLEIESGNECLTNANVHYNYGQHVHNYKTYVTKATTKKNGSIVTKCSVCGNVSKNTVIYYPKTIMLSTTSYTYDGKAKKPSVTVKDSKGKKISASNYTVSYSKGRKNVGKYTVTIKLKGNYSGTVKKTFTIKPKATTLSKVTAGKKAFTVKWKKQTSQTTGYQIQYSTSSKFKGAKTVTIPKNKTTSKKVTKLKSKKKYYVRVRTYKTVKVNGKNTKIYSSWSKAKTVKTK